jgi:hypothetical protein
MGVNSTVRMTGVAKTTILRLIRHLGTACAKHHDSAVRGLRSERIHTDEIWAFDYCKANNVAKAKAAPGAAGDVWTWTAIDADSKLIIAYRVGLRTQYDANEFMLDFAVRIVSQRPQLTTDGHTTYPDAVENAFGFDVDYAQLVKHYSGLSEQRSSEAKYSPPAMCMATKLPILGLPDSRHTCTCFVERYNLTISAWA